MSTKKMFRELRAIGLPWARRPELLALYTVRAIALVAAGETT